MTIVVALKSPAMDDEPTQAADLGAGETQSIHAWSQADDYTEPDIPTQHRGWKLPVAASLVAVAAVAAGAFALWPHHTVQTAPAQRAPKPAAQKPVIAPPPPAAPTDPDSRFIAFLKQQRIRVISPSMAIKAGHWVCEKEAQGFSDPELAQALVNSTPGSNLDTEAMFVDIAHEVYCP